MIGQTSANYWPMHDSHVAAGCKDGKIKLSGASSSKPHSLSTFQGKALFL